MTQHKLDSRRIILPVLVFFAVLGIVLFVAVCLVDSAAAQAITIQVKNDHVTYWGTTSETVTIAWDASIGATRYEWQAYHPETSMTVLTGNTPGTTITINLPKAGHYVIRLRACTATEGDPDLCSDWINTLDANYAQVDGQARSWWIYRVLAPPTDIDFGN